MAISTTLGDQHEVELPQGRVRYRERGSGPPLVFVHGFLVNADLWRKVVPHLADGYRCICPDLPLGAHEVPMRRGADLSPPGLADLIRDLLDALGIERATLVGNDTGGALVQIMAARYPERVDRLVLTNCDTYEHFPPTWWVTAMGWLVGRIPGLVWGMAQLLRAGHARRLLAAMSVRDRDAIDEGILLSYARPLQRHRGVRRDVARMARRVDNRYTLEAAERLRTFQRPVLLAWGADDRWFFPVGQARRLAAALPDARVEPIHGAGLFVPEDKPGELANLIREFAGAARRAQPVG